MYSILFEKVWIKSIFFFNIYGFFLDNMPIFIFDFLCNRENNLCVCHFKYILSHIPRHQEGIPCSDVDLLGVIISKNTETNKNILNKFVPKL